MQSITIDTAAQLQQLSRWAGHTAPIWEIAFNPDGTLAASCSNDRTIHVWDVLEARGVAALAVDGGRVWSVAFSPDGALIASGHEDGVVRLWEVSTFKLLGTLRAADSSVRRVRFSPDGDRLLTCSHSLDLWEVSSGSLVWQIALPGDPIRDGDLSPGGDIAACVTASGLLFLLDAATADLLVSTQAHEETATGVAFSGSGERLVTTGGDNLVRQWHNQTLAPAGTPIEVAWLGRARYTPNDDALVTLSYETGQNVTIWDADSGHMLKTVTPTGSAVAFNPEGDRMAVAIGFSIAVFGVVWTLTLPSGGLDGPLAPITEKTAWRIKEVGTLSGHGGTVRGLVFHDRLLASCGLDRSIRLWDTTTGDPVAVLTGHRADVRSIDFSPDGALLASASGDVSHIDDCVR
ncbi:MAG: WD40 repeat domain-containing protein, partial [Chloroflexi bacterium]|nr:WD40 repeat domain-containing protein [Chloroflexota bacterium]